MDECGLNDRERQDQVVQQFRKASKGGRWRQRDREGEVHHCKEMLSALPPAHHACTDESAFKYVMLLALPPAHHAYTDESAFKYTGTICV